MAIIRHKCYVQPKNSTGERDEKKHNNFYANSDRDDLKLYGAKRKNKRGQRAER